MTREETKQWILDHMAPDDDTKQSQVMRVVIKALEQQPCEDAISRQAVIDVLTKTSGIRGDALKALYDLPPVTPRQKTGHWIEDEVYEELYTCSECGCKLQDEQIYIPRNFCPNCGAEMGVKNDNSSK